MAAETWIEPCLHPVPEAPDLVFLEDVPQPTSIKLTLIVPAFNEGRTLERAVTTLLAVDLPCDFEVVVVDDGSTDATAEILAELSHPYLRCYRHRANRGKGAAVMTGLEVATGTHVLIFDADLEYSPDDIPRLIAPVLDGKATVVFGKRPLRAAGGHHGKRFLVGNLVTTGLARLLYRSRISDMHTCFKLLPRELLQRMPLCEPGFGLDTQLTVGALSSGHTLHEIPISYSPRTREEGKKINWRDGVRCIVLLVKYRFAQAVLPVPYPTEQVEVERQDYYIDLTVESAVA